MNRIIATLTAAAALTLAASAAQAARVAVFTPTGPGLEPQHAQVVGALFVNALANHQQAAVPPVTADPALVEAGGAAGAAAAATKLGVDQFVTVEILPLASKQVVTVRLSDKTGAVVRAADATVNGMDEMPSAVERMVVSLVEEKPVSQTRTLDTVISQDGQPKKLMESRTMGVIHAGLLAPFSSEELAPALQALAMGHAELDDAWVDVGAGLILPGGGENDYGYGGIFGEIGGGYHLTHTSTALFVGGGLDLRLVGGERVSGVGLVPFASVGVEMMRDSTSRFIVQARVGQNVLGLEYDPNAYDYSYDSEYNDSRSEAKTIYPTEIGLMVGVGI
jgi:hypothetical protein